MPTRALANARDLRHESTGAERNLWQHLRAGRLDGRKFRRQHPMGWRVLRFWDHDALARTEAVFDAIWKVVAAPNPLPNPSPVGRGALEPSP
nr:DUF559 domain-containing protein [Lysobacter sp. M2-1]